VKTTVEISDELLARARLQARRTGRPMRALIEEGLRRVLNEGDRATTYRLPDRSVGDPEGTDPLAGLSWAELRNEIYGGSRS
jgi:hypothetical protein